jgi:hypothetical protein
MDRFGERRPAALGAPSRAFTTGDVMQITTKRTKKLLGPNRSQPAMVLPASGQGRWRANGGWGLAA